MANCLLIPILAITASLPSASTNHHVISFSAVDSRDQFSAKLPFGLQLFVTQDGPDWEVAVYKGKSTDSLLYPQRNWHGAFPCQLSAWSHKSKTFPDVRVMPVRGYKLYVVVDLSEATSTGDKEHERFSGGTIKVWTVLSSQSFVPARSRRQSAEG